jgi:hypothetical protein
MIFLGKTPRLLFLTTRNVPSFLPSDTNPSNNSLLSLKLTLHAPACHALDATTSPGKLRATVVDGLSLLQK